MYEKTIDNWEKVWYNMGTEAREMLKSRKQLNEFYHTKIKMMRKEMRDGNEQESIFTY